MIEPFVEGYSAGRFDYADTPRNRLKVVWEIATQRLSPVTFDPDDYSTRSSFFIDFETDDHEQWKVELINARSVQHHPPFGQRQVKKYSISVTRTDGW